MHAGPLSVGGSWLRMLYFSAIVATTVGFGDIVPLTTEARILTALEAVLGVLFAGLFLNSIVRRP
jgi:Ion channel